MYKVFVTVAFAFSFFLSVHVDAQAQSCPYIFGCLDSTFGTGGKVGYEFFATTPIPVDMGVQADGKVVTLIAANKLVRLNPDGSLDPTFGTGGVATFAWTFTSGSTVYNGGGEAMRLQKVGGEQRVIVAGRGHVLSGRKVVVAMRMSRFMPDGTVDGSFGSGGTVVINTGLASELEIQSDSKILALSNNGSLVRTNSNGSLDTTFGSGGIVNAGYFQDIAIDSNGGILVGGNVTTGKGNNAKTMMAVKRYTSAGVLDSAFGIAGAAMADFGTPYTSLGKLGIDPYGNIVAAGQVTAPGSLSYYFAAARFTSNGVPDTSFGGTGRVKYVGATGSGRGVLFQSDGKILLTGRLNDNYGLLRYNYDGTLDSAFGIGGMVSQDVDAEDFVTSFTMQLDPGCACTKVVMASYNSSTQNTSFARFTTQ